MNNKILVIEDDFWISHSLKIYLENSSFVVDIHNSGQDAFEVFKRVSPNLIILDINLPEKDGITVCKEIRQESNVPIIMLTARTSEIDKIKWFETGADDYIAKPFSPKELLARINSILRRSTQWEKSKMVLKYKNIEVDLAKSSVTVGWKEINLTKNEFDILKKIFSEWGRVVQRETLMKDIIGYSDYLFDRTIDTHIKNIRKKIWDKDAILTIRWEWYRLNS